MRTLHLVNTEAWMASGACVPLDAPVVNWFADRRQGSQRKLAVAICHTCPVEQQCRTYAMAELGPKALAGVWGGLTSEEREALL